MIVAYFGVMLAMRVVLALAIGAYMVFMLMLAAAGISGAALILAASSASSVVTAVLRRFSRR